MAATGTPTPNIGLRIPQGTDPASVDDINYNSNLLDTKLGAVGGTSVQDQIDSLNSNFTPSSDAVSTTSWTTHQTALIASVSKSGNIATLNLRMVFTDGYKLPVNTDFVLIPSGFRPSSNIDMPALIQVNNADTWIPYVVTVQSTGYIKQGFTSNCTGIAIMGASYTI